MEFAFLGGGFLLMVVGSEFAVRGGVALTRGLGLPPLLIGFFIVGLGTSASELAVSVKAGLAGAPDIAIGNVVGSNILNLLLILGIGGLIRPMPSPPKVVLRDGGAMLFASVALALMAFGRAITRPEGIFLLGTFVAYTITVLVTDWRRPPEHSIACARAMERLTGANGSWVAGLIMVLAGVAGVAVGAHFAVESAIRFSILSGVPQGLIGLTLVAAGTSVPELLLTSIAAARGHTELAIGHLIGANTFNILAALGLTAAIRPLAISPSLGGIDTLVMLGASAVLLPMLAANWRLTRVQSALLLLSYLGYAALLAWRAGYLPASIIHAG